jgi:hypothetical protein
MKGMTRGMKTASAGDGPLVHLAFEWDFPEGDDQRSTAREAVDALFALAEGWIEVLGLEIRLACYDRETLGEAAKVDLARPYHLLVREPRMDTVQIGPTYRTVETVLAAIERQTVAAFVEEVLSQTCGEPTRHETGLALLDVLASWTPLPPDWERSDALSLDCYAGTITTPVERRDGHAWVAAPPVPYLVHQPVAISVVNVGGWFRLTIDVHWSPWVDELERRGSPLFDGIARLEARGWSRK